MHFVFSEPWVLFDFGQSKTNLSGSARWRAASVPRLRTAPGSAKARSTTRSRRTPETRCSSPSSARRATETIDRRRPSSRTGCAVARLLDLGRGHDPRRQAAADAGQRARRGRRGARASDASATNGTPARSAYDTHFATPLDHAGRRRVSGSVAPDEADDDRPAAVRVRRGLEGRGPLSEPCAARARDLQRSRRGGGQRCASSGFRLRRLSGSACARARCGRGARRSQGHVDVLVALVFEAGLALDDDAPDAPGV